MKKHLRILAATIIATATIGAATMAMASKTGNPCCANTSSACCEVTGTCCR